MTAAAAKVSRRIGKADGAQLTTSPPGHFTPSTAWRPATPPAPARLTAAVSSPGLEARTRTEASRTDCPQGSTAAGRMAGPAILRDLDKDGSGQRASGCGLWGASGLPNGAGYDPAMGILKKRGGARAQPCGDAPRSIQITG